MNKTLKLVFLAVMAMMLLIAAGCGSSNEESATEPQKEAPAEEAPAEEATEDKGVVNLYTARHYDTDRKLYDMFEEQTVASKLML